MKIAIKADPKRGKEILSLLESFGGVKNSLSGDGIFHTYYVDKNNTIRYAIPPIDYKVYTLEEFETEFPFKVGDNVQIEINNIIYLATITDIVDIGKYKVKYPSGNIGFIDKKYINIYNEMNTRNITLTLDKAKEWYNKGGELKEIALQAYSKGELTKVELPKTWEEFCKKYPMKNGECYINSCCDISMMGKCIEGRDIEMDRNVCSSKESAEAHLAMIQLEQLRNCWRSGWEPEYNCGTKYTIKWDKDDLIVATSGRIRAFLIFPTREMTEEFLECFRDLIEKAGDLI